ncbi:MULTISPECIES: hypothetical protein [Aeromonas]|uniref:hypothetical protein n=1 Tax=Aeromonas TaxID=642 RepID=UPI002B4765AA|nr:hypothetical protein [Aeromonas veronii]
MWCEMMSWFKKKPKEGSDEAVRDGIPYKIFGPGIMIAEAVEIRRVAKKQFDAANRVMARNKKRVAQ